jgi:hypothetical protein
MKQIEPVQIWLNGSVKIGNYIDSFISYDNLKDSATFTWAIYNSEIDTISISSGQLTMVEPDYSIWDSTADINQSAYEWICDQLSLTLIP